MNILLTNDDGYHTPGIQALYERLGRDHAVTLVAPDREKSAVSHGITLKKPLRIRALDLGGRGRAYAVDGTPADCVKLGLSELFPAPPDMVISGINPGCNIGIDINYSGTVSAAREGALNHIPSLSVSIKVGEVMDFSGMAEFIAGMIPKIQHHGLPKHTFLNVNAPDMNLENLPEVKITRQAFANMSTRFDKRLDPRNTPYYWYGKQNYVQGGPDTDMYAIVNKCISITPIQCDITDYSAMAELENLCRVNNIHREKA